MLSEHERILARPTASRLADSDVAFAETCAIRDLKHYRANVG